MKRGALVLTMFVLILLSSSVAFGACFAGNGCDGGCPGTKVCDASCNCVPEFSGATSVLALLAVICLSIIIKKKLR